MKCRAITISNRHPNVRFFLLGEKNMYRKSHLFRHFTWKILLLFRCILHEMSRNNNIKSPLQRPILFFLLGTQYLYLKSQSFSRSIKKMLLHFHPASIVVQQQYQTATPTCVSSCCGKKNISQPFCMANVYGKCCTFAASSIRYRTYRTMQM